MQFFLLAFKTSHGNCFDITNFRVILNISEVKYHFVVRFSICNVLNKVEDKQILLNSLNYTSLEIYFIKKWGGGLCLIGIKRAFVSKEVISTN